MAARGLAVTVSIAHFIGFEVSNVIDGMNSSFTPRRPWAVIAVLHVETVIHMSVKAGRTVEPGTDTDEDSAGEPFRTVVSVGRALVWGIVIIAIGTNGRRSDVDLDLRL